MTVVVIDPPNGAVVSTDEVKAHLRIDDDDASQNTYVDSLVAVAAASLDGPAGWLGRALLTQTLELRLDSFPPGHAFWKDERIWGAWYSQNRINHHYSRHYFSVPLPFPPVAEVVSVKYYDADGADQTVDPTVYRVLGGGGAASRIVLAEGQAWPDSARRDESVRIQYTAGYGVGADVPAPIRHAILLMVGNLYANRESVVVEQGKATAVELPQSAAALLAPYHVML